MDNWIAKAIGIMHVNNISQSEVAEQVGVRREHINKILNGKITPAGAKERITTAIDKILAERAKNKG